jgi:hypothetical protein
MLTDRRLVVVSMLVALVACGPPTDLPRVPPLLRSETLAAEPVPGTLEEAFEALDRGLSSGDLLKMWRSDEDAVVESFYGPSRWRFPWNLSRDGPLRRELSRAGFQHPDDMVEALLRSFWRHVRGRPIGLRAQADRANAVRERARTAPHWVVFPRESAESLVWVCRDRMSPPDGTWEPEATTIREVEEALPGAFQRALEIEVSTRPSRRPTPPWRTSDYYRQYGGLVFRGERIVYVNGFHQGLLPLNTRFPTDALFWQTRPVHFFDAWVRLFAAEYDPAKRRIRSIMFESGCTNRMEER